MSNKLAIILVNWNSYELTKNTFNLKYRYISKINDNVGHLNILMSLENQTIGFIENSFKDIIKTKRHQTPVGWCIQKNIVFPR